MALLGSVNTDLRSLAWPPALTSFLLLSGCPDEVMDLPGQHSTRPRVRIWKRPELSQPGSGQCGLPWPAGLALGCSMPSPEVPLSSEPTAIVAVGT